MRALCPDGELAFGSRVTVSRYPWDCMWNVYLYMHSMSIDCLWAVYTLYVDRLYVSCIYSYTVHVQ